MVERWNQWPRGYLSTLDAEDQAHEIALFIAENEDPKKKTERDKVGKRAEFERRLREHRNRQGVA